PDDPGTARRTATRRARAARAARAMRCETWNLLEALDARFLVVEVFLDLVEHFVADLVLPPQPDQLAALGLHRRGAQALRVVRAPVPQDDAVRHGEGDLLGELGADALGEVVRDAVRGDHRVDRGDRHLAERHPGALLLLLQAPVLSDLQAPDERLERQA